MTLRLSPSGPFQGAVGTIIASNLEPIDQGVQTSDYGAPEGFKITLTNLRAGERVLLEAWVEATNTDGLNPSLLSGSFGTFDPNNAPPLTNFIQFRNWFFQGDETFYVSTRRLIVIPTFIPEQTVAAGYIAQNQITLNQGTFTVTRF